jgi:hypothetical protein
MEFPVTVIFPCQLITKLNESNVKLTVSPKLKLGSILDSCCGREGSSSFITGDEQERPFASKF